MSAHRRTEWVFSGFALRCARAFLRAGTPSGAAPRCSARGHVSTRARSAPTVRVPREFILIVTAASSKSLHLLCIDPHTLVGDALHKILTTAGYHVTRAQDLESALRLASAGRDRIDVVISDHEVPPGSALDVLEALQRGGYQGRVIVHSGQLTTAERAQYTEHSLDAVLEKKDDAARLLSIMKALHGEEA